MTSLMIIEGEVFSKRSSRFGYGCVGLEIHLLVLAVHADVDRVGLQAARKASGVNCAPWSVLNIGGP